MIEIIKKSDESIVWEGDEAETPDLLKMAHLQAELWTRDEGEDFEARVRQE